MPNFNEGDADQMDVGDSKDLISDLKSMDEGNMPDGEASIQQDQASLPMTNGTTA
jgi:hypothetical protein